MNLIDISPPVSADLVSWQDRFPVDTTWHSRTDEGDRTSNSTWLLNAHTGAHVDAPLHHLHGGRTVDELDLGDFLGPCRVLELPHSGEPGGSGGQIAAADLAAVGPRSGERLLLRTRNSEQQLLSTGTFTEDYTALSPDAARHLVESGVRLVGVDYLSVEPYGTPVAETHHILLGAGVAVLEGLCLEDVPEGDYQLLFLPLRLAGGEAAPGRAVLLDRDAFPGRGGE